MAWTLMNIGDDLVALTLEFHGDYRTTPAALAEATDAGIDAATTRIRDFYAGSDKETRVESTLERIPAIVTIAWAASLTDDGSPNGAAGPDNL